MIPRLHLERLDTGEHLLSREQSHYVLNVLRCRTGEALVIYDGKGHEADAMLLCEEGQLARISVGSGRKGLTESPCPPIVLQGLCLGDKMDWVIQKATEMGAGAVWPIAADRSQMKLEGSRLEKKIDHWRAVAEASASQCGRSLLPVIAAPMSLDRACRALLDSRSDCQTLQGWVLDPRATGAVGGGLEIAAASESPWIIAVGPESGWTDRELEIARHFGLTPSRMGPRVLRTETAALVALSLVALALREFG